MRPDRIVGLFAAGLALAACSPEGASQDAAPETPGAPIAAAEPGNDVPAVEDAPSERSAAEPETQVEPDPQVRVDLPAPPVRVPENPPTH